MTGRHSNYSTKIRMKLNGDKGLKQAREREERICGDAELG